MRRTSLVLVGVSLALLSACQRRTREHRRAYRQGDGLTLTRDGTPIIYVGLMSEQRTITVGAAGGVSLLPGSDGAAVDGSTSWTVTVEGARPARVRYWTVVAHNANDVSAWQQRGFDVKTFDTGQILRFGEVVLDRRERLTTVSPEDTEAAALARADALAEKYGALTSVYPEVLEPATGTLIARDARGEVVRETGAIWFAAPDGGPVTVEDVVHGGGGAQIDAERRHTRRYGGRVYVTLGLDGLLTAINEVSEDRYLAGVVPSELPAESAGEALKAQAVAARVEMLAMIGTRHYADPFMVCSTQHCQVYGGSGREDPRAIRAVEATSGEVLINEGGGLVRAYYSSSCGGFSENNENVWGGGPESSLRGHLDALGVDLDIVGHFGGVTDANIADFLAVPPEHFFCGRGGAYHPNSFRWTLRKEATALDQLVAAQFPAVGAVRDLVPLERGISGRIRRLRIVGAGSTVVVTGELRIRRLFGGLRSSMFVVTAESEGPDVVAWTFQGGGFGHGVGMCQTGAVGMAESGYDHRAILGHYYPGSRLQKLY